MQPKGAKTYGISIVDRERRIYRSRNEKQIGSLLNTTRLPSAQAAALQFELERLRRIRKDFDQTPERVIAFIRKYIPQVSSADLARWENEKSLEYMLIDGKKRYFKQAARNLFRLDTTCRKIWQQAHPSPQPASAEAFDLDAHDRRVMRRAVHGNKTFVEPRRFRIRYTITLKPNQVPDGEVVRCWIPFPREIPRRQTDIKLVHTKPGAFTLAPNDRLQRTIYFEQTSSADAPLVFSVQYEYTSHGVYGNIEAQKVKAVNPNGPLKKYLQEDAPHIVFSDRLRRLSQRIVGDETNPYRIAQKLFAWVDEHITWASAREYSTIANLPAYALENGHGDCGIQTMLFITLCRLNGIPARWQSGWEFKPPSDSMHDWGMIYFEPYGWLPVDVTYGLRKTEGDEAFRWFYLHGMDSYRLIFNDGFSIPFEPSKKHFRSETVDSQRGELEWRGGNLYFDQWQWQMDWQEI